MANFDKFDKTVLLILILAIVGFRLSRYWDKIRTRSEIISLDGTEDSRKIKAIILETSETNIRHLDLSITGELNRNGTLTIGETESTSIREFPLKVGKINVDYDGDWYSQKCYLTFTPQTVTKGELKISADFAGN